MQEVAKLRRSLDDAEGLSRDTKKEWAILRSQNLSLEESVVSLSSKTLTAPSSTTDQGSMPSLPALAVDTETNLYVLVFSAGDSYCRAQ